MAALLHGTTAKKSAVKASGQGVRVVFFLCWEPLVNSLSCCFVLGLVTPAHFLMSYEDVEFGRTIVRCLTALSDFLSYSELLR